MNIYKLFFIKFAISLFIISIGCSKLLEVDTPRNHLITDMVFSDSISSVSAIGNIYFILGNGLNNGFNKHISLYSDEYFYTRTGFATEYNEGRLKIDNSLNFNIWTEFYQAIYASNDIIENLEKFQDLSENLKRQLTSEAKFIRAFCYYHLFVLYENVPLLLTSQVESNRNVAQADSIAVFTQIIEDLTDAKNGLPEAYPTTDRARANKWASGALLSQVYLYQNRWDEAFRESNEVLESGVYSINSDVNKVFLASSNETILQIWRTNGFISDATTLIPISSSSLPEYIITESLLSAYESNDLRKENWFGENEVTTEEETHYYYYPYKYKNRSASNNIPEFLVVSRLSEQYLIRAEARTHLNDFEGATRDLNIIRDRAGLTGYPDFQNKEECLDAVFQERRVELFGEWGKRFIDLKRLGTIDVELGERKELWEDGVSKRMPIPYSETLYNTKLMQNEGYSY